VFLDNNNVDFVYAQGFSSWYYAKKKYYGEKLPEIGVNFHGLEMFQRASSIKSKLEQLIFSYPVKQCMLYSDYIYSLGGKLTNLLVGLGYSDKKIIVTPIGIDASWLAPSVSNTRKSKIRSFVFIGRYEERKGINELLIVLKELLDSFEFKFHFIGPIPENKQIASSRIFYHGLIKDEEVIKKILKKSDIIVVPSYSEGMPTVILEAMASGCAVIATDVGAVSEQVDGKNGWIISPGDIALLKSTMVDALRLTEKELLKKKNRSIQRIIDKFLWDKVIAETVNNVTKCLCKEKF
jgi:glycosyltransferase involved in cell wall biosynthesis